MFSKNQKPPRQKPLRRARKQGRLWEPALFCVMKAIFPTYMV